MNHLCRLIPAAVATVRLATAALSAALPATAFIPAVTALPAFPAASALVRAVPASPIGPAASAAAPGAPAAEAEGGWLERLQRRLDGIRSFRARFVQEYEPRAFSRRQVEGGTVAFQRPGRMRWDYEWPEEKLALCDGERVWIYYPGEKRAEVERLAGLGEEAPAAQILLGRWRIAERFRLQAVARRDGEVTLHLEPAREMGGLRAVRLTVSEGDLTLRALEAEEEGGNILRYRFEGWREGEPLPDRLFWFEPPEGVSVAGEPGGGPAGRP